MRRGSSTVSAYVDIPASISMSSSRFSKGVIVATLTAMALATVSATESLAERRNWFDTPFDPAVVGLAACPRPEGPLITQEEMRQLAHARIERGTSCWLAKKCEDSNAYRRDPEIQRRVIEAVASMPAYARSSVWVTTERGWVTLQGCLESTALRASLIDRVRRVAGVETVFDQLIVGTGSRPRWKVDPAWQSPGVEAKKGPTR
jgi:BON domain